MNSYNVIQIADLHFGAMPPTHIEKELENNFFPVVEEKKEDLDLLVIGGDLFDKVIDFNSRSGIAVVRFVSRLADICRDSQIHLRIIQGTLSHDNNQLRVFKEYEDTHGIYFRIIEKATTEKFEKEGTEFEVLYLPEEYPSNYVDFYGKYLYEPEDKAYAMTFGHGMIDFVAYAGADDLSSERPVKGTPTHKADDLIRVTSGPLLFGHVHRPMAHKNQIYYPGSFTRWSFDVPEDRGFIYAEVNLEDPSDFDIYIYPNPDAPTYGVIDMDKLPAESLEEKLEIINVMKEEYEHVKFKVSNKADREVINQLTQADSTIKVQDTSNRERKERVRVSDKFKFVFDEDLTMTDKIKEFINVEQNKDIPTPIIQEIISKKPVNLEELISMKEESLAE